MGRYSLPRYVIHSPVFCYSILSHYRLEQAELKVADTILLLTAFLES